MSDERRGGSNGAVVAIVVVLGMLMFMGVVFVVGVGFLFYSFESMDGPMAPPPVATSSLPAQPVPVEPLTPELTVQPPEPKPPIMRPVIQKGERIQFAGKSLTLEEFKSLLAEMKARSANLDIRLHVESDAKGEGVFIQAVTAVCQELELNFTLME